MTVRDLLAWVEFICHTTNDSKPESSVDSHCTQPIDLSAAYVHGACIVFVDALVTSGHSPQCCDSVTQFHHQRNRQGNL